MPFHWGWKSFPRNHHRIRWAKCFKFLHVKPEIPCNITEIFCEFSETLMTPSQIGKRATKRKLNRKIERAGKAKAGLTWDTKPQFELILPSKVYWSCDKLSFWEKLQRQVWPRTLPKFAAAINFPARWEFDPALNLILQDQCFLLEHGAKSDIWAKASSC